MILCILHRICIILPTCEFNNLINALDCEQFININELFDKKEILVFEYLR